MLLIVNFLVLDLSTICETESKVTDGNVSNPSRQQTIPQGQYPIDLAIIDSSVSGLLTSFVIQPLEGLLVIIYFIECRSMAETLLVATKVCQS